MLCMSKNSDSDCCQIWWMVDTLMHRCFFFYITVNIAFMYLSHNVLQAINLTNKRLFAWNWYQWHLYLCHRMKPWRVRWRLKLIPHTNLINFPRPSLFGCTFLFLHHHWFEVMYANMTFLYTLYHKGYLQSIEIIPLSLDALPFQLYFHFKSETLPWVYTLYHNHISRPLLLIVIAFNKLEMHCV